MNRIIGALAAVVAVLAVAVPVGVAGDGTPGGSPRPAVVCAQTSFLGRIVRVGVDGVLVRPGQSESGRLLAVKLTDGTVVRQNDAVVDTSALAAGLRARFLVRACRSGDGKVLFAKVIVLLPDPGSSGGSTAPPPPPPAETTGGDGSSSTTPPPAPVCGQGEMNTVLVAVAPGSITVRTESAEGVKTWPITVDDGTIVRKGDQTVSPADLHPGDLVHVVLIRCPAAGTVRAVKIVVLTPAA